MIVADNTCLCNDAECISHSDNAPCAPGEAIVADDGSGGDISIPTMLMFKSDADAIKEVVRSNQVVQMQMSWSLSSHDDRAEYQLWTTPTDVVARDFLLSFKDVAVALGNRAYFTPQMSLLDGKKMGCAEINNDHCAGLCTNYGRYCASEPADSSISGAEVVEETLRRLCIWRAYGDANGIGIEWWDYVGAFDRNCSGPEKFMDEECIKGAYVAANIDDGLISRCMRDSGGLTEDVNNALLDMTFMAQVASGIYTIPSVVVDSVQLRGRVDSRSTFEAICEGFTTSAQPEVCERCLSRSNQDVMGCAKAFSEKDEPTEPAASASDFAPSTAGKSPDDETVKPGKKENGMMKPANNATEETENKRTKGVRGGGSRSSPGVELNESAATTTTTSPASGRTDSNSHDGVDRTSKAGGLLLVGGLEILHVMGEVGGDKM